MRFSNTWVKAVKADLAKKEITLTFTLDMSQQSEAEELARYMDKDKMGAVDLQVSPKQLPLMEVKREGGKTTVEEMK